MKNTAGMSFVEILIVVLIIVLINGSGFFYLSQFLGSSELSGEVKTFEVFLDGLDSSIKKYDLLTYQVDLSIGNGYTYYTNIHDGMYAAFQSADFMTGIFIVTNFGTANETWNLKTFADDKLKDNILYSANTTPVLTLKSYQTYSLESYFSGVISNKLGLGYYSEDNLKTNPDKMTKLTNINTKLDKSGTTYTSVKLVNKNGNKKILSGANELDTVYLFFQKGEQTGSLLLTK